MLKLEETVVLQTRLLAIEHVLARTLAAILVGSGRTADDVDKFQEASAANYETMTFPGYDAALSDLIADEFREHIKSIYGLVKGQAEALSKK